MEKWKKRRHAGLATDHDHAQHRPGTVVIKYLLAAYCEPVSSTYAAISSVTIKSDFEDFEDLDR